MIHATKIPDFNMLISLEHALKVFLWAPHYISRQDDGQALSNVKEVMVR